MQRFSELAAPLLEKLRLPRGEGKKGSKKRIIVNAEDVACFEELKKQLLRA